MAEIDYDEIYPQLKSAAPDGWLVHPPTITRDFRPRPGRPMNTFEVTVTNGRYIGARGEFDIGRRLEVRISAESVDALVAALRSLPALEFVFALPLGTEFDFDSYDD